MVYYNFKNKVAIKLKFLRRASIMLLKIFEKFERIKLGSQGHLIWNDPLTYSSKNVLIYCYNHLSSKLKMHINVKNFKDFN